MSNRHKDPEYHKKYYQRNREKLIARATANQVEHKDERRMYMKDYIADRRANDPAYKESERVWKATGRKRSRPKIRKYEADLYKTSPNFKLAKCLRSRIHHALRGRGAKSASTLKLLGCSIATLMFHLECQFQPGMSWANYGDWHVDHITPCAAFNLENVEHQRRCFHYQNLQPLWALDNLQKSDKLPEVPANIVPLFRAA